MRYDYDRASGKATAGVTFADASDGLAAPSSILFSGDGNTIFISNLGATGVARFRLDGSSAGPPIFFAPPLASTQTQFSGLAFKPTGELLVGAFQDFPAGTNGAIGVYAGASPTMDVFVPPAASLNGASGLLVHDESLYVTSMFASNIQRFHLADGSLDTSFLVSNLAFPQGLMLAPDGAGFLAGVLGFANGQGHIAHYDFNGDLVGNGVFASPVAGGFTEPTAFVTVPDQPTADFNSDGKVNAADLTVWRQNFGAASGATLAKGDADGNGKIDGHDFLAWQRSLTGPSGLTSQTVPEPSSVILALAGFLGIVRRFSARVTRRRFGLR